VECNSAIDAEVRLYDRLFSVENPSADERDFRELLNPDSLKVVNNAKVEGALRSEMANLQQRSGLTSNSAAVERHHFQFLKQGYFVVDDDSTPEHLVFNRTASLKDNWQK
jgi:glutaminyl-tRNA synthetase